MNKLVNSEFTMNILIEATARDMHVHVHCNCAVQSLQAVGKYPPRVRAVYGSYPGPSAVGVRGQMQLG